MEFLIKGITAILIVIAFLSCNADAAPKITQAAFLKFKVHDYVHAVAVEEYEEPFKLLIIGDGNKIIFSTEYAVGEVVDSCTPMNPFLRFRTYEGKEFLSPIIVAVLAWSGANENWAELRLIAEKKGKFRILNPEKMLFPSRDGVFLGHINNRYGNGMIIWRFEWGDEGLRDNHKYTIKIYRWDRRKLKFSLARKLTTKKKYASACAALKHYGLPCRNLREEVVNFRDEMSTLGLEDVLLVKKANNHK